MTRILKEHLGSEWLADQPDAGGRGPLLGPYKSHEEGGTLFCRQQGRDRAGLCCRNAGPARGVQTDAKSISKTTSERWALTENQNCRSINVWGHFVYSKYALQMAYRKCRCPFLKLKCRTAETKLLCSSVCVTPRAERRPQGALRHPTAALTHVVGRNAAFRSSLPAPPSLSL